MDCISCSREIGDLNNDAVEMVGTIDFEARDFTGAYEISVNKPVEIKYMHKKCFERIFKI